MALANGYRRVYYYHLKKCGGTSMNAWLASQFADHRLWNPRWTDSFPDLFSAEARTSVNLGELARDFEAKAPHFFRWAEVVYSHAPLRNYVPSATFSFTALRRPIDRVVSQVADWQRLDPSHHSGISPVMRQAIGEARTLPLESYLSKYAKILPQLFDNYLVRALATSRLGVDSVVRDDLTSLAEIATCTVDDDFDLVGITDRQEETKAIIADTLGFAPEPSFARLNVTKSEILLAEERYAAADILADLTRFDQPLYDHAKQAFEKRLAAAGILGEERFERLHASPATDRLNAEELDGSTAFSVKGPIVGSGFHQRDGVGQSNCRVWSGPGTRSVLYIPVPTGLPLHMKLWVHGYAAERQRHQLQIEIDDRLVPHRYEGAEGWREVIVVDAISTRPWIKLTMLLDETLTSEMAGVEYGQDTRLRGISFDRYGWEIARSN